MLNLGSLDAGVGAITNAITADPYAPCLVEYGGAGGTIRAVTNIFLPLNATLYGTNENAVSFDSQANAISLSGNLTGTGGFNKTGSGTLTLSGTNTYAGSTRILEGRLTRTSADGIPAGGVVLFGVTADDKGGQLYEPGDLSLAGLIAGVANPDSLDKEKSYTIATYGGALTAEFAGDVLPKPWFVYYDWARKSVRLSAKAGTVLWLR